MADQAAVNANAAWCDVVCTSLGLPTEWATDAWRATEGSPDGYPDAVTLAHGLEPLAVLTGVDGDSGCSVKDSFAELDLAPLGFRILFDATWIRRSTSDVVAPVVLDWHRARTPLELRHWSEGHDLDVFVPALLDIDGVCFFEAGAGQAGFACQRTDGVVSVSNLIAQGVDLATVWSDMVAIAGPAFPGLDLVGYEMGVELEAGLTVGFVETGPLRVWIR